MKRLVIAISLMMAIFAIANLIPGRAQEAGAAPDVTANHSAQAATKNWPAGNPLKIALLKWYQANTTTSFEVGNQPGGVAFDGQNIWVASVGDDTVSKLRASDGTNLGTFKMYTGAEPLGLAFDGASIWVANSGGNDVVKLRASDGAKLGDFTVGNLPYFLAFDGENIWTANHGDGTVSKLRASDGKTLGTFPVPAAIGVAFDGDDIWVTDYLGLVYKLRAKDGKILGSFQVGNGPIGIAFDGTNVWVANNEGGRSASCERRTALI